jgi:FAD:protein FMN transferase
MDSGSSTAQFAALGTTAVVQVTDQSRLPAALAAVEQAVSAFDLTCSRFRDDSELHAVNRAAGSAVRVSALFLQALEAALRAARVTDGDVDPTVGEALIALGYDRDFDAIRPRSQLRIASVPGWKTVQFDPAGKTVRVPRGVSLDFGATAKALAADRAAAAAFAVAGCGVLVALGGDLAVAGQAPHGGWSVRVTDDHAAGSQAPGQWIAVHAGGLATSSTAVRRWRTAGQTVHHLVNPATGAPAKSIWRTVSACAASCLDANIATTAAIIRGERAIAWLQSLALPSRLVGIDGTVQHLAGWPAAGEELPVRVAA